MSIVTVFPPIHRETTKKVTRDVSEEVIELAIRGEVVVANVVAEPAELLKAKANNEGTKHPIA